MLDNLVLKNAKSYFESKENNNLQMVVNAISVILDMSYTARREGLLELEHYAATELKSTNRAHAFAKRAVMLIVNGTEPEVMQDILSRKIMIEGAETFVGYVYYIVMHGMLLVQMGMHPLLIKEELCGCIPDKYEMLVTASLKEQFPELVDLMGEG